MLLIDGDNVKPGVLLIQQGYVRRTLHNLDRIGRIHGAHQTEGQAASGVIAVSGVVALPFLQARVGERQFRRANLALILVGLAHVGDVGSRPEPTQIRLTIRGSGRRTSLYRRRRLRAEIPSILRWLGKQGSAGERSKAECCSEKRSAHEDLLVERPLPWPLTGHSVAVRLGCRLLRGPLGRAVFGRAREHALAARQFYGPSVTGVGPVLRTKTLNGSLIANFQRISAPAVAGKRIGRTALTLPMSHRAAVVLGVQINPDVRIHPVQFRNDTL